MLHVEFGNKKRPMSPAGVVEGHNNTTAKAKLFVQEAVDAIKSLAAVFGCSGNREAINHEPILVGRNA